MALPVAGAAMAYIEPPYVEAKFANFIHTKMAGISNLSISAPASDLNMRDVFRHLSVSVTVTDLYSVMMQEGSSEVDNQNYYT
jgi:hypothetical protein